MTLPRARRSLVPIFALALLSAAPCFGQEATPPKVYIKVVVIGCEGKSLDKPEFQKEIESLREVIKDLNLTYKKYSLVKVHRFEAAWKTPVNVNFCLGRRLVITPLAYLQKRIRAVYQFFSVSKDAKTGEETLRSLARMKQKSKEGASFVLAGNAIKTEETGCNELLLVLTVQTRPFKKGAGPEKD